MKRKIAVMLGMALLVCAVFAVSAFATEGSSSALEGVTQGVTSGFQDVVTQGTSMLTTMLPIALGLIGAVAVVTLGIRLYKKLSGKAG